MDLARVMGSVTATVKYPGLEGVKLKWVQPLDESGKNVGPPLVACDATQSGVGDTVFLCGGREAALALDVTFVPVDASIVGIVDKVDCACGGWS
ncbi:MAG: EutN/CcmL family microcompartment protein [Spirochaetia bacterium]